MEWVSDWKQVGKKRRKEEKMGSKRRRRRGKGTYKAAMRTVFFPVNGGDEFLEVFPRFACIVRYRDFL